MKLTKPQIGIIIFGGGFLLIAWLRFSTFFSAQDTGDTTPDELSTNIQGSENQQDNSEQEGNTDENDENESNENNNEEDTNQASSENTTITTRERPLTILFPPFYSQKMINQLSNKIKLDTGLETAGRKIQTRRNYQAAVANYLTNGGSIDMMIIPSKWWENTEEWGLQFELSTELRRFYHEGFHDFLFHDEVTIVPFAIDPLILYTNNNYLSSTDTTSSTKLLQFIANNPKSTDFLPIAQGIKKSTIPTLSQGKSPFYQATSILGAIVNYSLDNNSTDRLLMLINNSQRSQTIVDQLVNSLQDSQYQCTTTSALCLLTNDKAGFAFGLLSTAANYSDKFSSNSDYTLQDIPFGNQENYPTMGWGIVINNSTTNKGRAQEWIDSFISLSVETNTIPYPWYVFGPSYNIIQRQSVNTLLQGVNAFKNVGDFTVGSLEAPQGLEETGNILYDTLLQDLLNQEINHKVYLQALKNREE